MTPNDPLTLAEWRRAIAEAYAAVRHLAPSNPEQAWREWRAARDTLFKTHPQTPLAAEALEPFQGLSFYPYDPQWRLSGRLDRQVAVETFNLDLPVDGRIHYTRVARASFPVGGQAASLSLFWIEGYGGGLFLPFNDATNGGNTYGGGRYLFDTIKGADLGVTPAEIVLDFNFAYNPSCAYDPRWVCPLAPRENRLAFPVPAGEQHYGH
jgi:uncharacterized protein (DUF1684 family)